MDHLKVTVSKPVYGGYGMALAEGKVLFIADALPGEELSVSIRSESRNYSFASVEGIITPSPWRIAPECPVFTRCGGCSYLCAAYEAELSFKKAIIEDCLTRIGKIPREALPETAVIHDERYHYRSHGTVKALEGRAGFFEKGTNSLVPLPEGGCLLLEHSLNEAMMDYRTGEREFRIALDSRGQVHFSSEDPAVLNEHELGLEFHRGIWNFFQANRFLRSRMITEVAGLAGLTEEDTFLDIGCGVGFFTLALAGRAQRGTGVDTDRNAISFALYNARINGLDNVDFHVMPAAALHPERNAAGVVIVDPPRAGLDKKARRTINAMKAPALVYVSCNPSTFSRDAGDFIKAGYHLDRITFIDMFPGTHHIELISRFVL